MSHTWISHLFVPASLSKGERDWGQRLFNYRKVIQGSCSELVENAAGSTALAGEAEAQTQSGSDGVMAGCPLVARESIYSVFPGESSMRSRFELLARCGVT